MIAANSKGFSLVEAVVSAAVVAIFVTALISVYNTFLRTEEGRTNVIKATFLAEEGLEKTRFLRDGSSQNLSSGVTTDSVDSFNRTVTVTSGASTANVVSKVDWTDHGHSASVSLMTNLNNLYGQ